MGAWISQRVMQAGRQGSAEHSHADSLTWLQDAARGAWRLVHAAEMQIAAFRPGLDYST